MLSATFLGLTEGEKIYNPSTVADSFFAHLLRHFHDKSFEKPTAINLHISSVIRQKGGSQNGCFKKTKQAKFSEKRTFLSP